MKVAVFGGSGQVATELRRRAPADVTLEMIGRARADFTSLEQVEGTTRAIEADAIVNAVAYTAVDNAEEDEARARLVNATSVGHLARAAADRGIPLVHLSTDYVFNGTGKSPRQPEDTPAPLGAYGRTKLEGEKAILAASGRHIILRTSWVFSSHGSNFVKTMLRLSETRDRLNVVSDQVGGPTPAAAIADACFRLCRDLCNDGRDGIYHFSGAPDVSWAEFAREIFRQAGRDVSVQDIPTAEYPTPARRPLNSRLDCTSLARDHGIKRPDWRSGLAEVLKEIT